MSFLDLLEKEQGVIQTLLTYHNREDLLRYLVKRGGDLAPLDVGEKLDEHLIPACLSKIWLLAEVRDQRMIFKVDADSKIVKGLASLLVEIYHQQLPEAILAHKNRLPSLQPLATLLPQSKRNGMAHFVARIGQLAEAALELREKSAKA